MFEDRNAEEFQCIKIESSKKIKVEEKSAQTQTDKVNKSQSECQTSYLVSSGVQTTPSSDSTKTAIDFTDPDLLSFLRKGSEMMEKELKSQSNSNAFVGYKLLDLNDETSNKTNKISTILSYDKNKSVSCMDWSPFGENIAATLDEPDHENSWCGHFPTLCIWNLKRKDFNPEVPQRTFLSGSSCLTVVRWHPRNKGLLATGSMSGKITIWSTQDEHLLDPILATSTEGHNEKITGLEWILKDDNKYTILSSGVDGKLIIWNIDYASQELNVKKEYIINAESLPKYLKIRSRKNMEISITTLTFSPKHPDIAIVGTDSGIILGVSLLDSKMGEVATNYQSHAGRIISIDLSIFQANLFLSAGSDQEIHLNDIQNPRMKLLSINMEENITSVSWNKLKSSLFSVTNVSGDLIFYSIWTSKPVLKLENELKRPRSLSTSLNKKIAVGFDSGEISIWSLSDDLFKEK